MITIKNILSGETKNVYNTEFVNGYVRSNLGKPLGKRFANGWAGVLTETTDEDGQQVFTLSADWEVVTGKGERKQRQQKAKKSEPKAEPTVASEPEPTINTNTSEPITATTDPSDDPAQRLYAAISDVVGKRAFSNDELEAAVMACLVKMINDANTAHVIKSAQKTIAASNEVHCANYNRILAKVSRGNHVYLYGPAGTGKSHTAEQIARDLGLDFYGQTTVQFAHDVRGYCDANGNFVDTAFYKAFRFGGVYCQDEYDRSMPEAAVVLNTALANKWYDFPGIGRVEQHPNFRFIATGNTTMKGADSQYTSGQQIDASSIDRFAAFFRVDYLEEVELHLAHGNCEMVNFVHEVRSAIESAGIMHVVSYRAIKAMTDEVENENDIAACCRESVFKGLEPDEIRIIYGGLINKDSAWAKATKKCF